MNDAALIRVHRLEHDASAVLLHLLRLSAGKLAELFLAAGAITRDIHRDALVIVLALGAVCREVGKILQRVQRFAVVTDQHGRILAVNRDAAGVLLVSADRGFHFNFKVLDERLNEGDGCLQLRLGGGRLRLLRLRFTLCRCGRFLGARLCRAGFLPFGSVGARCALRAGHCLCLRLCRKRGCGCGLGFRLCLGL